jgi:hypothetical protein
VGDILIAGVFLLYSFAFEDTSSDPAQQGISTKYVMALCSIFVFDFWMNPAIDQ